ncbi:hypothetical protein IP91_01159 [Pseudoduganella lurida]|uniref:Uncharacterized protein n=1 Tax=Pseudoduganella lurida TaxID=1036180 RepID=A0A562RM47_9BURK|nr:hypothetical protein [Pseudoduganella lurida]TWI70079.1 hypothetical protein IP91_01159 [Pseudoduganella lurida]
MSYPTTNLKPAQWLLLVALLACYPLSFITPARWAWENGVIEDSQVVILLGGLVSAFLTWRHERRGRIAMLALCVMPIWAILAARELSWGAVFLPPLEYTHDGPVFSSKMLAYKPLVTPTVALLLAWSGWVAWRHRVDKLVLRMIAGGMFPWFALAIAAVAMVGSGCAEGHLSCGLVIVPEHEEALEELVELVAYGSIVFAQALIFRAHAAAVSAVRLAQAH